MHHNHFLHAVTIVAYLVIAWQFRGLLRGSSENAKARFAQGSMVFIFSLCALVGYLTDIAPVPAMVEFVAHIFLIACAVTFILFQGAKIIERAIKS